jgi:hypothetical protein
MKQVLCIDIYLFLDFYYVNKVRQSPLFSIVPQLFYFDDLITDQLVSFFRYSPVARSINSFEFDPDCGIPILYGDEGLRFSQSPNLTHISITLRQFYHCVNLLNQLGSQLHSFAVSIVHIRLCENLDVSQLISVNNFLHFVSLSVLFKLVIMS